MVDTIPKPPFSRRSSLSSSVLLPEKNSDKKTKLFFFQKSPPHVQRRELSRLFVCGRGDGRRRRPRGGRGTLLLVMPHDLLLVLVPIWEKKRCSTYFSGKANMTICYTRLVGLVQLPPRLGLLPPEPPTGEGCRPSQEEEEDDQGDGAAGVHLDVVSLQTCQTSAFIEVIFLP